MNFHHHINRRKVGRRGIAAFTLAEVLVAITISMFTFAGVITCYTQCTRRAQWSGYSLAAQALAIKELEQARAAVWDWSVGKNEITNLNLKAWTYNTSTKVGNGYSVTALDLPISGTNNTQYATNFVIVRMVNLNNVTNPLVQVQMVQVDTVWQLRLGTTPRFYTNTVANYFAPDNRDGTSL